MSRKTWPILKLFQWIGVAGLMGLGGCTEPYSHPQIEPTYIPAGMTSAISGIADQAANGPLKVIWTHGVCKTGPSWVINRVLLVQAALGPGTTVNGSAIAPNSVIPAKDIVPAGLTTAAVQVYKIVFKTPAQHTVATYFVVWSDVDEPNRAEISYDATDTTHTRATLNNGIKGFFDNCLVDAVAYSGHNGPIIRDGVKQAIEYALDQPDSTVNPQPLAYVSESLGSKILFDIVGESTDSAFIRRSAQFDYFFMMANQIPILDQAGVPTPDGSQPLPANTQSPRMASLRRFLNKIRKFHDETRPNTPPTIVSFFDPNDLLSYELSSDFVGTQARLINVVVSNDDTWFGYIENPLNAHCGYGTNQRVINMVMNGGPDTGPTVPPTILALACK